MKNMILYCGTLSKCGVKHALMREVADRRVGKFPRSMSDFKPGEKDGVHKRSCGFCVQRRSDPLSGIVCNPSNAGFIMCREEKHGRL